MKRKLQRKSWSCIAQMHTKALGKPLPPVFAAAIKSMAGAGIHPNIFRGVESIRRITFCAAMAETEFQGAYHGHFGGRQDKHYPEDNIDWMKYGWDGGTKCMIYPNDNPVLWVVVHEFGHYIDDIYFCKDFHHFKWHSCHYDKIKKFISLRAGVQTEFEEAHKAALASVSEEEKQHRNWYRSIPVDIWYNRAPTQYALFSYTEWIAESFRLYCLKDNGFLSRYCPRTVEFLSYALQGEVFHRNAESRASFNWQPAWMEEDVSYAAVPAFTYETVQVEDLTVEVVEVVKPWPEHYITDVIECPPE